MLKWVSRGVLFGMLVLVIIALATCSVDLTESQNATEVETAEELKSAGQDCWQGRILKTIYKTIGILIMTQFEALSQGAMSVMMIGFAIWVAIRLLKFVSSVREDSPAQIWNEILKKAFICLFCGLLACSSQSLLYVINVFLFPIYAAFLDYGSQILELAPDVGASISVFNHNIGTMDKAQLICRIAGDLTVDLNGFPSSFSDSMNCMICSVADRMRIGRRIAFVAMDMKGVLPVVTGFLLLLIFLVVGLGFVFYLVDSVFRFGMMILLLPIFIMAYAFGPTKKWTKIGFTNIMTSAAFMMAFSIIVATSLMAMMSLISQNHAMFNPSTDTEQLHMQNISFSTLSLLLIGFLIYGSLGVAQQLTSVFIGGKTDSKFQNNLKAVAQTGKNILVGSASWVLDRAGFSEKTKLGRLMKSGGALRKQLDQWAGR